MQKILLALAFIAFLAPIPAAASYGADFALDGEHSAPASFNDDGNGGFFGTTIDGYAFTQKPVLNQLQLKLHKFTIDEAFFYIGKNGAFTAHSDLAAVSILLSQG